MNLGGGSYCKVVLIHVAIIGKWKNVAQFRREETRPRLSEGTVFSVKIPRDAKVEELRGAIASKYKVVSNRIEVYPATLTLYLARKKEGEDDESKWLKDDDNVKSFLVGKIFDENYKEMRPSWKLTNPKLLGTDLQLGEEVIHILVKLLEPAAGVFDEDRLNYVEAIRPIPASDLEVLSKVLRWIIKCFNCTLIDLKDNDAKRLHMIAPILWAVVQVLPDVKVFIEEDLDGNRVDAHGHFEFVLVRGTKRVCIVEAKEEKFKQGMAQALLSCEVAADLDHSHEVYALVTNAAQWRFLKSLDEEILCDEFNALTFDENGLPHAAQLSNVTGKLHSMLSPNQPPPQ